MFTVTQMLDRSFVIGLLNSINYDQIPHPNTTKNHHYFYPSKFNCWMIWDGEDWVESELPASLICFDVETTDSTKTLAIASAVDMLTGKLYAWYSDPTDPKLLDIQPGTLYVAHSACFESSFIARNYTPHDPLIRALDTYSIATQLRHPFKIQQYLADPSASRFAESSACSLADLYFQATFEEMDKSQVQVFISSKGHDWSKRRSDVILDEAYKGYASGKMPSKLKKLLPVELQKVHNEYPRVPTVQEGRDDIWYHLTNTPENKLSDCQKRMKHAMAKKVKGVHYQYTPKLTKQQYYLKLRALDTDRQPIASAFEYNIFDTLATVKVIESLIGDLNQIDDITFAGLIERSVPMFCTDPKFEDQLDVIDEQYDKTQQLLHDLSQSKLDKYIKTDSQHDGQDWTPNSDRCAEEKRGLPAWYSIEKVGFTKTITAITMEIFYKGKPVKRVKGGKPVLSLDSDSFVFPQESSESDRAYFALYQEYDPSISYAENMAKADFTNCLPFENPNSTDAKNFKGISSFFSKSMLPEWVKGNLTCNDPETVERIKDFITTSYWRSIKKRMRNLMLVQNEFGKWVAPRSRIAAAISGRSSDPVFLVQSKQDENKLGSEMQGFFCAPAGFKLVGFDLDSCQARLGALLSDAEYCRVKKMSRVILLSTEFSRTIFNGKKEDHSTLAHKLGLLMGYDYSDPKQLAAGYAYGKNAQFSLLFWVGVLKLAKMLGISVEEATKIVNGFRGVRNKYTKMYSDGMASHLCNAQLRMSQGYFPSGDVASVWRKYKGMRGTALGNRLPNFLSPFNSGSSEMTTKCNVSVQSGDVGFLNFILNHVKNAAITLGIDCRYTHSVHDAFIWMVKDEDVEQFKILINNAHRAAWENCFRLWAVDFDSVPDDVWLPSSIEVTQRWLKSEDAVTVENSRTLSFGGYAGLEFDDDDQNDGSSDTEYGVFENVGEDA